MENGAKLNRHMSAVGRVNVTNLPTEFLGTAWVIDDGLSAATPAVPE
jgi:hypothetical protein